ncbi:hypothetical protein GCM10025734_24020 [Kitasatospora paranensis]
MSIAGDWYNEFGSHMRLTEDPSGGLTGTYVSGAGHAAGSYPLTGRRGAPPVRAAARRSAGRSPGRTSRAARAR